MRYPLFAAALAALATLLACLPATAHDTPPGAPLAPGSSAGLLTRQLRHLGLRLRAAPPEARPQVLAELLEAARARRQRLEALIDGYPAEVLRSALSPEERALLPAEVQAELEEDVTEDGEVEVLHADTVDGGYYLHALRGPRGRRALRLAGRLPDLVTGDRVRVRGVRVGGTLAADGTGGVSVLEAVSTATLGEQQTLVIVLNFSNTLGAYTSTTVSQYQQAMFGSGASISQFFREASYNRAWLTGTVVGPFTIAMTSSGCNYSNLATLAKQAATLAGVTLTPYKRLVYAFPDNGCAWGGLGTIGGTPSQAWINGGFSPGVVAHEILHGFGLYHSHSLECGSVAMGGNCSGIDYGDTLDVMGIAKTYHPNAPQKERLSWLGSSGAPPVTTVQQPGVYTLAPYESTAQGAKALRVQLANGDRYYMEYRAGLGFDASIPSSVRSGIVVHFWDAVDPDGIYLLDMTPATSSWSDPALPLNATFQDQAASLAFTPVWVTATDAGVNVGVPGAACTRGAPTVAVSPSVLSGEPGDALAYTVTVTNRDAGGCAASTFALDAAAPAGWAAGFAAGALTVAAGASASTTVTVTSPPTAPLATYAIDLTAADAALSGRIAEAIAQYAVVPAAEPADFADEFDRPDAASLGNGWSAVSGQLRLEAGEARNAGTSGVVHTAVLPDVTGTDQEAEASFARVGTQGGPRFGVILRYQGPGNYYACYRQTGGTSKLRVVRVANGKEVILRQVSVANPAVGSFFAVGCRAESTLLTLLLDGAEKITVSDATFGAGSVGLQMGHPPGTASSTLSHRADHFRASAW